MSEEKERQSTTGIDMEDHVEHGSIDNHLKGFVNAGYGLIQGLGLTLQNMFRQPVTIEYPNERWKLPPGYRGMPVLVTEKETGELLCVGCGACARACPPKVIHIETSRAPKGSTKKLSIDEFSIDMTRCMVCNLCVEACPFDALAMSQHFEIADYEAEGLVFDKEELVRIFKQHDSELIKTGHSWQPIEGENSDWMRRDPEQ